MARKKASKRGASRRGATRETIAIEALRLFAAHGFAATTVGDIEAAAGLTPRAGGFYRHYESKESVLEAAIERHVAGLGQIEQLTDLLPLGDLEAELTLGVRAALQLLRGQGPLLVLLMRDGHGFPELQARVHERLVDEGYEHAKRFFEHLLRQRRRRVPDLSGVVAIAVGSIVHFVEDELRFGVPPAHVPEERFVATWVEVWALFVRSQPRRAKR